MTAKIKLNAASGGGSISIQAPSSSSNNRVISLPDIADGTLVTSESTLDATKLSGNLPAISGAALTGISAGIEQTDTWRMTANLQGTTSETTISTNLSRATDGTYIGAGMSHSSGVFTFPVTGKWLIYVQVTAYGQYAFGRARLHTQLSTNSGASYDLLALAHTNVSENGANGGGSSMCQVDITNTSTHKVRFRTDTNSTSGRFIHGAANYNVTAFTFIRLGDT